MQYGVEAGAAGWKIEKKKMSSGRHFPIFFYYFFTCLKFKWTMDQVAWWRSLNWASDSREHHVWYACRLRSSFPAAHVYDCSILFNLFYLSFFEHFKFWRVLKRFAGLTQTLHSDRWRDDGNLHCPIPFRQPHRGIGTTWWWSPWNMAHQEGRDGSAHKQGVTYFLWSCGSTE